MKAKYNKTADTLVSTFRQRFSVAESDGSRAGVILDFDAEGGLVSMEMLDALKQVGDASCFEVELAS